MAQPYRGRTEVVIEHPLQDFSWRTLDNVGEVTAVLGKAINAVASGAAYPTTKVYVAQGGVQATATVTFASPSGTTEEEINGVTFSQSTGTASARATALAAAVNASSNPLISGVVTASALAGVVTLTAVQYGPTGNLCTLVVAGTGVSASGANFSGGEAAVGQYLVRP